MVSEPPRPSVVTSDSVDMPWKPATSTILPSSRARWTRCGADIEDLGPGVRRVGDDAGLGTGEGYGVVAQIVDGHGQQGRRDAFAGGEEHVHLALGGILRDLPGQLDQLVGGVASGRDHRHDGVSGAVGVDDPARHSS